MTGARVQFSPEARSFAELRGSGLLWLINRVVFHPRGWALALVYRDGEVVGWSLEGNGREVWQFDGDETESFEAARRTLAPIDEAGEAPR